MPTKSNTEEFLLKYKEVNSNYLTNKVEYTTSTQHVILVCPKHGEFSASPSNLLKGKGCKKCAIETNANLRVKPHEEILQKAVEKYGDVNSHELFQYKNSNTKVDVTCKVHGLFSTLPHPYLAGTTGCPSCREESNSEARLLANGKAFLRKANTKKKNSLYNYNKVDYKNSQTDVVITCSQHGDFYQTPANHLSGQGCPSCAVTGFKTNTAGTFYILECEDRVKVGITNKAAEHRADKISKGAKLSFSVLKSFYFKNGRTVREVEAEVLKWLRSQYTPEQQVFNGSTECFQEVNKVALINYVVNLINNLPKER